MFIFYLFFFLFIFFFYQFGITFGFFFSVLLEFLMDRPCVQFILSPLFYFKSLFLNPRLTDRWPLGLIFERSFGVETQLIFFNFNYIFWVLGAHMFMLIVGTVVVVPFPAVLALDVSSSVSRLLELYNGVISASVVFELLLLVKCSIASVTF